MSSECIQDDDLLVWVRLPGLDDLMTMDALRAPIRDPSPVRLLDYAMTPFALCLAGDPTEHWAELLLDDPVLPSRAGKRHRASAAEDDVSSIATIAKDPLVAITQPRPAKRARCCQASDPAPRCEAPVPQRPHQPAPDVERQGQPASTGCHIPVAGSLVKDPVAAAAARVPKHARYNTRVACVHCSKHKLRCDRNRPCQRCVNTGRGDSCVDRERARRRRRASPAGQPNPLPDPCQQPVRPEHHHECGRSVLDLFTLCI